MAALRRLKVRFTRRAAGDLAEIGDYIAIDSPAAAKRVRAAIARAIDLLSRHPYVGIENARSPDLRSWLILPYAYRVHYRVRGRTLWIVHIRHTSRQEWRGPGSSR